ncbi:MAG: NUDIX domain-containing protein [Bacilli bacterium]|nr:NUDIX domain-containing protein [Bacilli bacterium]
MEFIDIVDENDNLTGEIKDRDFVHNNNLYHRHVSCFILNKNGEVLLQRRSMTKKKNPGIWSKTGGHVDAGETLINALKREVKEEIGLEMDDNNIFFMNKFKSSNPNYFSYGYIYITDNKISDFNLQLDEVDKVEYFKIEDLENEKRNNNKNFTFYNWEDDDFYNQMNYLKEFIKKNNI